MNGRQRKTGGRGSLILFLPALLLAGGFLVGGCESDSVTPHDTLPAVTDAEAAQQASLVAVGIANVGPELLAYQDAKPRDKELGVYTQDFGDMDNITGRMILEYFTGGSEGVHAAWNDADFARFYTPEGESVVVEVAIPDVGSTTFDLVFDLQGDIDHDADTATVSGGGILGTGDYHIGFTLADVVLSEVSHYPEGGTFDFVSGGLVLVVEYDGDVTASVSINDVVRFEINLDTGIVTPVRG